MIQTKTSLLKNVWEIVNAYPGIQSIDVVKHYKAYYGETLHIDILSTALSNLFRINKVTRVGKRSSFKYTSSVTAYETVPSIPAPNKIVNASSAPAPLSNIIAGLPNLDLTSSQAVSAVSVTPQPKKDEMKNASLKRQVFDIIKSTPDCPVDVATQLYNKKHTEQLSEKQISGILCSLHWDEMVTRIGIRGAYRYTICISAYGAIVKNKPTTPAKETKEEVKVSIDLDKLINSLSTVDTILLYKKLKGMFAGLQ